MTDDWLKDLVGWPARAHVARLAAHMKESIELRKRLGDPAKRDICCGPRQDTFEKDRTISQLPELAALLEPTTADFGYEQWFGCRVCGQDWIQGYTQEGKNRQVPIVFKARETGA